MLQAVLLVLVLGYQLEYGHAQTTFTPSPCNSGISTCPSVTWTYVDGKTIKVVVTSSNRTGSLLLSNNYVSFSFAKGQKMADTTLVLDCYNPSGVPQVSTSNNIVGGNVDYPAGLALLSNISAAYTNGVLNCTFTMPIPDMNSYVIIAEGNLQATTGKEKAYHGTSKWWSNTPYTFTKTYTSPCKAMTACSSVSWTSMDGQSANFTLTSSVKATSNNYVSFSFAKGQKMTDTGLVIDCYDPNGVASIGTSQNAPMDNNNYTAGLTQVSNSAATKNGNVLTCTFNMALPGNASYVVMAEGLLGTPVTASIKKVNHGTEARWASTSMFPFAAKISTGVTGVTTVTSVSSSTMKNQGGILKSHSCTLFVAVACLAAAATSFGTSKSY